jgi:polysaccharide export outer membrane protein
MTMQAVNSARPRAGSAARRLARGCTAALLLSLCGCYPGSNAPELPQAPPTGYRLGSGDQIRIITFGEDQLTGEFTVDDQGKVALPLLGPVPAADATPEELGQRIAAGLEQKKLLREASVSVQVLVYRPIFVLGEVNKPGQYPFQPGMTMLTAAAVAGGFTYRAIEDYAGDVRTTNGEVVQGKVTPGSFLAPGDVVRVYERIF